jgi:hypothetical protein
MSLLTNDLFLAQNLYIHKDVFIFGIFRSRFFKKRSYSQIYIIEDLIFLDNGKKLGLNFGNTNIVDISLSKIIRIKNLFILVVLMSWVKHIY